MVEEPGQHEKLDEFLTVSQAAAFIGVSPSTLRNWDRTGKVKAIRHPVNGYRLYRRVELRRIMDRLRQDRDEKGEHRT